MKNLKRKAQISLEIKLMIILFIVFAFISCSSNDDKAESITIVETWELISIQSENTNDFNGDGTPTDNLIEEFNCSYNQTLVFKSDGTGTLEIKEGVFPLYDEENDEYIFECISPSSVGIDELIELTWTKNNSTRSFILDSNGGISTEGIVSGTQLSITAPSGLIIFDDNNNIHIEESTTSVYMLQ